MAKTAPLSVLPVAIPGEDPETTASRQKYIEAQEAMLAALQARNEFIDPRHLAVARAFLQPTRSGRFGESLGNVMEAYGTADEAERKRNIEMAQIRAELAANRYGAAQKGEALKEFSGAMQPSGQAGQTISVGGQEMPAEFAGMTLQRAQRIALRDKELGELAFKALKAQQDQMQVRESGIFNIGTGQFTPAPGGAPINVYVPELGGDLPMTRQDQVELSEARRQGDGKAIRRIINRLTQAIPEPSVAPSAAPTEAAQAGEARPAALTIQERERREKEEAAQRDIKTTAEKKLAESAAGRTSQIIEQGNAARQSEPTYVRIETLLNKPGVDRVVGVLEKNGALEQIGSAVEEAVRAGSYSIGAPSIRKILTNAGTPQELIDISMQLASAYAQLNFDARKGLGSGTSVSNFEQQMVNQMGISLADTVGSAKAKLAFLREQARFRQEVASALKEARKKTPGLQYDDFEETDLFKNKLFPEYIKRQEAIVNRTNSGETPRGERIQTTRPAATSGGAAPIAPGTEKKLGGKIWVYQSDGSWQEKDKK